MKSEEKQVNLEEKKENLEDIKPVNSQEVTIDLSRHDKKEVSINKVEVVRVKSQYTPVGFQWVVKVSSQVVDTIGEGDDIIEFWASELFNLIQDENGELVGYPTSEGSNLVKFMKDIGADLNKANLHEIAEEIKGKKALMKYYTKTVEGHERGYLKFRY